MSDDHTDAGLPPALRWSQDAVKSIPTPHADAFLAEVIEVCRLHGYVIGHEDAHGAFVVEMYSGEGADRLRSAALGTDARP
jgi:hypothetical protein